MKSLILAALLVLASVPAFAKGAGEYTPIGVNPPAGEPTNYVSCSYGHNGTIYWSYCCYVSQQGQFLGCFTSYKWLDNGTLERTSGGGKGGSAGENVPPGADFAAKIAASAEGKAEQAKAQAKASKIKESLAKKKAGGAVAAGRLKADDLKPCPDGQKPPCGTPGVPDNLPTR